MVDRDMKPILFNTAMVRAILSGQKRCTRRVARISPECKCIHGEHEFVKDSLLGENVYTGYVCKKCGFGVAPPGARAPVGQAIFRPKYNEGDILYVRETWASPYGVEIKYAADYNDHDIVKNNEGRISFSKNMIRWSPSIHMPKKAARILLKVTEVRLEKLQEISNDPPGPNNQVVQEGFNYGCDFIAGWNNTISKSDYDLFGWDANPWVWVYQFEIIS